MARPQAWDPEKVREAVDDAKFLAGALETDETGDNYRLALGASYELDLWDRLRNATEAARAELLAAQAARDTVRIAVAAAVAQSYFTLRALDLQIATTQRTIEVLDDSRLRVHDPSVATGCRNTRPPTALFASHVRLAATAALRSTDHAPSGHAEPSSWVWGGRVLRVDNFRLSHRTIATTSCCQLCETPPPT